MSHINQQVLRNNHNELLILSRRYLARLLDPFFQCSPIRHDSDPLLFHTRSFVCYGNKCPNKVVLAAGNKDVSFSWQQFQFRLKFLCASTCTVSLLLCEVLSIYKLCKYLVEWKTCIYINIVLKKKITCIYVQYKLKNNITRCLKWFKSLVQQA